MNSPHLPDRNQVHAVPFAEVAAGDARVRDAFLTQLAYFGWAKVILEDGPVLDGLVQGVTVGRDMGTFRFPPVGDTVTYTPAHRACFRSLYSLGRACLGWILDAVEGKSQASAIIRTALDDAVHPAENLFAPDGDGHEPFASAEDPFGSSFFNIFDYDHGLLNAHKDRYLVTTIFADSNPETAHERSVLWVKDRSGRWRNVDAGLQPNEVVFMIGEELEEILAEVGSDYYAADHCIRVDPDGEYLERAHFRRDPSSLVTGNRLSTAFILGEPKLYALGSEDA